MAKMTSNVAQKGPIRKTRNWGTVVYPESAPADWLQIITDIHVAALVSPLHDSDVNPGGEPKKPHHHVMFMFDGPKEESLARSLFEKFGGVGCEYINSARAYGRYLCHLDNPEKHRYNTSDVKALSGADYQSLIATPGEKYKVIAEMMDWVDQYNVDAYSDLLRWARLNREDWFLILCDSGTYVMKEYLKSKVWKAQQEALLNQQAELDQEAQAKVRRK